MAIDATGAWSQSISAAATGLGTPPIRSPTTALWKAYQCSIASPVADHGSAAAPTILPNAHGTTGPDQGIPGLCRHRGQPSGRLEQATRCQLTARAKRRHRDVDRDIGRNFPNSRRSPRASCKSSAC